MDWRRVCGDVSFQAPAKSSSSNLFFFVHVLLRWETLLQIFRVFARNTMLSCLLKIEKPLSNTVNFVDQQICIDEEAKIHRFGKMIFFRRDPIWPSIIDQLQTRVHVLCLFCSLDERRAAKDIYSFTTTITGEAWPADEHTLCLSSLTFVSK